MADGIEDDWDSSSPIGSPSSSLPQSIREILESVRAECNAGAFGAFCSSNVDKPSTPLETSLPHKGQLVSHDKQTAEFDDMKEMVTESHGQTQMNLDCHQEVLQTGPQVASQVSVLEETEKSVHDLTEVSNFEAHEELLISPQENVAEDEEKNTDDVPMTEQDQPRVGVAMECKPTHEHFVHGQKKETQAQQEDSLRSKREQPNLNKILAHYQNTKFGWIKIGKPSKKLSPETIKLALEFHQSKIHGSEPLPTVNPKEIKSAGVLGLKLQSEVGNEISKQDDLERKSSKDHGGTARVTKMEPINSHKEPILKDKEEDTFHLPRPIPETALTQPVNLADDPESPGLIEENMKRRKVDKSSLACSRLAFGVEKEWAAKNAMMVENETQSQESQECFPQQNHVTAVQPGETSDFSEDEDQAQKRMHVDMSYKDLMYGVENSEHQSLKIRVKQRDKKGAFKDLQETESKGMDEILEDELAVLESNKIPNEETIEHDIYQKHLSTDDSQISMEVQESKDSHAYGLPELQKENSQLNDWRRGALLYNKDYPIDKSLRWQESDGSDESLPSSQNKMDLDGADVEMQINHKRLKREEPTKGETLHNQLKEKYLNTNFSKEMTPKEYQECKPVYEEIEEFARACNDSPTTDVRNTKMKLFSDNTHQAIHRSEIHGRANTGETKDEFDGESKKHSVLIWRQELLSSDFNLIYGSLRAVLMGNLSSDDRRRLIQTMIATMSEIEEVTMGEGKPIPQSVRCETPELTAGFDEEEKELDSSENEEIKKESESSELYDASEEECNRKELATLDKIALRDREAVLNVRRMDKLMKKSADGTLTCLVCKKRGLPSGRVCRACSAFAYRVERRYTIGIPIPTCFHANYSGGLKCKSCRFRKFSFMSMTATDTRTREVNAKVCPICKRSTYYSRGWKCGKCSYFFLKLTQRKGRSMPTCKHDGEFLDSCDGCRCYNFQVEWANYETNRVYPLPLVKKKCIKRKT